MDPDSFTEAQQRSIAVALKLFDELIRSLRADGLAGESLAQLEAALVEIAEVTGAKAPRPTGKIALLTRPRARQREAGRSEERPAQGLGVRVRVRPARHEGVKDRRRTDLQRRSGRDCKDHMFKFRPGGTFG